MPENNTSPAPTGEQSPGLSVPLGSMRVDLTQLEAVIAYLRILESMPLDEITWLRNDEIVPVSEEILTEWKFTGLNNRHFAQEHLLSNNKITHGPEAKP